MLRLFVLFTGNLEGKRPALVHGWITQEILDVYDKPSSN